MYRKNDVIAVVDASHRYYKRIGTVDEDQVSESWVAVTFESSVPRAPYEKATIHPFGIRSVRKAEEYRKGDRVRVITKLGAAAGKEGTVEGPGRLVGDSVNVLIDGDNSAAGFHYTALELTDPAPDQYEVDQIAHRTDGSILTPSSVKVGDLITVSNTQEDKERNFKTSTTTTALVTRIAYNDGSNEVESIWTDQNCMIYASYQLGQTTITLVKGVEDLILNALRDFRLDAIIAFDYGKDKRRAVAVKTSPSRWHVIGGTGPKSVHTNTLRLLVQRANDSYDILETGVSPKG